MEAHTLQAEEDRPRSLITSLLSPYAIAFGVLVLCTTLLLIPLTLPVGPMYWDLVVYLDGAQRVLSGQTPSVDFFAPIGPLGYWLAALGTWLFPSAQLLLLVQWSLLLATLPAMLAIAVDVDRRSRPLALALFLPFLFFQLVPVNVEQYSTFPGVDAYGIYNRHVSDLLYVLTAGLLFPQSQRVRFAALAGMMLALFLLKITGFLAGGLLCFFALLSGRITVRFAVAVAAAVMVVVAGLEASSSIISAYVRDIAILVTMNEGALLPRFLQAASLHFGVIGSAALLALVTLVVTGRKQLSELSSLIASRSLRATPSVLDRPVLWLAVGLAAGLFFEAQNTGGHAFVFLWPVLLLVLGEVRTFPRRSRLAACVLVAATAIPPVVEVSHRLSRALIGQVRYVSLDNRHLGTLGLVSQRVEAMERAEGANDVYGAFPATYQAFADRRMLPGWSLYSDLDFQIGWLMAADEGAEAVLAYEEANDVRFETIFNLNFVNPFPAMLDRTATRHVAIGGDPFRTVPEPDQETLDAIRETDLILYPTCPITIANEVLRDLYAPGMSEHREVVLSPCWTAYVRD